MTRKCRQLLSGKNMLEDINELETSYSSVKQQILTKHDEIEHLKELLAHARNCMINFQKQIADLQKENDTFTVACKNLNN